MYFYLKNNTTGEVRRISANLWPNYRSDGWEWSNEKDYKKYCVEQDKNKSSAPKPAAKKSSKKSSKKKARSK